MSTLRIVTVLATLLVFSASHAFAQPTTPPPNVPQAQDAHTVEERQAVSFLLTSYHELPARAAFERAARDPQTILSALADRTGPIADRALEALFLWPTDELFTLGSSQLADPGVRESRKHRLMMLMAETFEERAVPVIAPFLKHRDRRIRITAAAALAEIRTGEAFALIDEAVQNEKDPAAAKQLERYSRRVIR